MAKNMTKEKIAIELPKNIFLMSIVHCPWSIVNLAELSNDFKD